MKKTSDNDNFLNVKDIILNDNEEESTQSENFISNSLENDILMADNINDEINNKKSNDKIKNDSNSVGNDISQLRYLSDYDGVAEEDDDYDYDDLLDDILDRSKENDNYSDVKEEDSNDSDLKLLKAYIGKNYDNITTKRFNVFGFVFTLFYMLYRKMYFLSFLFLICIFGIIFIKKLIIALVVYVLLSIGIGLFINKIYIDCANKKINKIKLKNSDLDFYELRNVCSLRGGTNFKNVVYSILIIIITCGLFFIFNDGSINSLKENIVEVLSNIVNKKDNVDNKYNGFISYDSSIKIESRFSISVPEEFVNESSNYSYDYKYYVEDDIFSRCRVKFASVLGYGDSNELINKMFDYYKDSYETDGFYKINVNDLDWTWFSYKNSLGIRYFYATTLGKKVYLFSYEVDDGVSINYDDYRIQILESIKRK